MWTRRTDLQQGAEGTRSIRSKKTKRQPVARDVQDDSTGIKMDSIDSFQCLVQIYSHELTQC
ncbi:hypothetical protein EXIGLDRAFT_727356 [Exidia glandulosa HHB12029]|uniref:Uncharacterized protein n=1 Tax=Exidia glandulosa HHB12029 TaxID=1314781 RepID=A0A165M1B0_EXIGL|nr:hypothetical protein EXIGLDRAFT_727356 [Exidia glandulosa HHB12029]